MFSLDTSDGINLTYLRFGALVGASDGYRLFAWTTHEGIPVLNSINTTNVVGGGINNMSKPTLKLQCNLESSFMQVSKQFGKFIIRY